MRTAASTADGSERKRWRTERAKPNGHAPHPDDHNRVIVQRALKPDGGEMYTIELSATAAAVITGAAAMANMEPVHWVLSCIGDRIADQAGLDTPPPAPSTVN